VRSVWVSAIRDIIAEEPLGHTVRFVEELLNSDRLKEALGSRFDLFAELVPEISSEG
jgi:hypothetical protein